MNGPSSSIRVLHVDDEPGLAETAGEFLERTDDRFDVVTADSATRGLETLRDADIDCVISDYDMPETDGLEFLEIVREEFSDLPFVLFTGEGSEEVASEAISAGVTDYLQKESGTEQYEILSNRVSNAVERMRADRERKRQLDAIESAREGISILDEDGRFIYVNEAYAELYGYAPDELHGERWELLYREEDAAEIREEILPRVRESGHWRGTTTGLRADGSTFLEDHALATTDRGGLVCTVRDISEERERQEQLEWKTRTLDEAPVGIVITEPTRSDGPIVYANEHFERLTGHDESEVVGRDFGFLRGDATDPDRIETLRDAIEAGEPVSVDVRNYRKDGSVFWNQVTVAPVENDGGEITRYVWFQQDVTERKTRERELEQADTIFRHATDAIFFVDVADDGEFRIKQVNPACEEQTGLSADELRGMTPREMVGPENGAAIEAKYRECVERAEPLEYEERLAFGETPTYWHTKLAPIVEDGSVDQIVGVTRNVTERKERQRKLERQKERLEEFASVVSHDLRNPLTTARGYLELAREGADPEHLDRAKNSLDRMERTIDDVLWLSRRGRSIGSTDDVVLRDVIEGAWRIVDHGTGADLRTELDPSSTIVADGDRLRQLLENVLRNAIEHAGSDVSVRAESIDGGFAIEDDGPGIPPDERESVFERGYTSNEAGTGFGLHIVDEIADAHGWDVRVTEGEDGGARFEIVGVE